MLPLDLITSLSPKACKTYLLLMANAQGRQVTVSLEDLAAEAKFSERSSRRAVQELLSARILRRFPRRYHTPSAYLISTPTQTGQNRPTHRPPLSGLLTPSATASPPTIAPQPQPRQELTSPIPDATNRSPEAALLTLSDALAKCHTAPSIPHDLALVETFQAIPAHELQAALQLLPQVQRSALIGEIQAAVARLTAFANS